MGAMFDHRLLIAEIYSGSSGSKNRFTNATHIMALPAASTAPPIDALLIPDLSSSLIRITLNALAPRPKTALLQ